MRWKAIVSEGLFVLQAARMRRAACFYNTFTFSDRRENDTSKHCNKAVPFPYGTLLQLRFRINQMVHEELPVQSEQVAYAWIAALHSAQFWG